MTVASRVNRLHLVLADHPRRERRSSLLRSFALTASRLYPSCNPHAYKHSGRQGRVTQEGATVIWTWAVPSVAAAAVVGTCGATGAAAHAAVTGSAGAAVTTGNAYTPAFGLNDQDVIVGTYGCGGGPVEHGYVLRAGVFTTLDAPGSAGVTHALGINHDGDVVGEFVDAQARMHGFLLHDHAYTTLNAPVAQTQTVATQINDAGDIVGAFVGADNISHGFLLHNGAYTTLDDPLATGGASAFGAGTSAFGIENDGTIVGSFVQNAQRYGFLLHGGAYTTIDVPGSIDTFATGVSAAGAILGGYNDPTGDRHGYLLSLGTFMSFNDPNGPEASVPHDINGAGDIVGAYSSRSGIHGFLLHNGTYTTIKGPCDRS